jgi:hypothetical protein
MEIFKDIPGYEGIYQVSNYGRVKSLSRELNARNNHTRKSKELILSACIDSTGYFNVVLYGKSIKIHVLVAMAFLNHKPGGYIKVVDHIDNNKLNNNLENLQIVSQRYNVSKKVKGFSKYIGVSFDKERNKWVSHIRINGKTKKIGRFDKEIDAANSYQEYLKLI